MVDQVLNGARNQTGGQGGWRPPLRADPAAAASRDRSHQKPDPTRGERPRPLEARLRLEAPTIRPPLSAEDAELDALWRARFGEALPILGCADIVRGMLGQTEPVQG